MDSGLRRRRSRAASEGQVDSVAGGDLLVLASSVSEETTTGQGGVGATVSPFWSERMQIEAQLQAARPADLDEVVARLESGPSSASTELRRNDGEMPTPSGPPMSHGPSAGRGGADESTTSGASVRAAEPAPPSLEGDPDLRDPSRAGMRPGERLIMERMKELLEHVFHQNSELVEQNKVVQGRLERLEEETTMRSASSGCSASGLGRYVSAKERGSVDYHEGVEEGMRRALAWRGQEAMRTLVPPVPLVPEVLGHGRDLSPPPPPRPRDESYRPTTPNGTAVPLGTPPESPTPQFGSPQQSFLRMSFEGNQTGCMGGMARNVSDSGSVAVGGASTETMLGMLGSTSMGLSGAPDARVGLGSYGQPPTPAMPISAPCVPMPAVSGGHVTSSHGRDPYSPGDRTWWKLPSLCGPLEEDACIAAADWITQVTPVMGDLSPASAVWWRRVLATAQDAYNRWQVAGALEKASVTCNVSAELQDARYARLESRAVGMLLEVFPEEIKQRMIADADMSAANAMFRLYLAYQPGGLSERQRLLQGLTDPGTAKSGRDMANRLQKWQRWLSRAQTLLIAVPDAALLLAGLDRLAAPLLATHPQVAFRCNSARNIHQLDFSPTTATVMGYARLLQAEAETLALSGSDVELSAGGPKPPKAPKNPKDASLARVEEMGKGSKGDKGGKGDSSRGLPKGAPSEGKGKNKGKDSKPEGTAPSASGKGVCKFFVSAAGCKLGKNCRMTHDTQRAQAEGRCFACGSGKHKIADCTRPKGDSPVQAEAAPPSAKAVGHGDLRGESDTVSSSVSASTPASQQFVPPTVQDSTSNASGQGSQRDGHSGAGNASVRSVDVQGSQDRLVEEAIGFLRGFRLAALQGPPSGEDSDSQDSSMSSETSQAGKKDPQVTKIKSQNPKHRTCLLDGGATHCMRTGTASELQLATPTRVGLAQGQAHMHVNAQGTLLTDQLVQPICSLGLLVKECGYKVSRDDQRFELRGPNGERIETRLRGDCPVVSEGLGLAMIKEIEDKRHSRAVRQLYLRVVRQKAAGEEGSSELRVAGVTLVEMLEWLSREAGDLGESVLSQVPPESFQVEHHSLVLNRRKRRALDRATGIVIHAFAGHITPRDLQWPSSWS